MAWLEGWPLRSEAIVLYTFSKRGELKLDLEQCYPEEISLIGGAK